MNKASGRNLPPLDFTPTPLPPVPGLEVYESNSAASWSLWDAATAAGELRPAPRDARVLVEEVA